MVEFVYTMLSAEQVFLLEEPLAALGEYHNRIAENREYCYPTQPVSDTVETIADGIREGRLLVRCAWCGEVLAGFCIIGTDRDTHVGELKYLYTDEAFRGAGLGGALTDWAMTVFSESGMERIDLRVVLGNPAVGFYEKYGFTPRILVMSKNI